jgi:hypothetical protein
MSDNKSYRVRDLAPIRPLSAPCVTESGAAAVSLRILFQVKEENRGNGPIKTRKSPFSLESGAGIMM